MVNKALAYSTVSLFNLRSHAGAEEGSRAGFSLDGTHSLVIGACVSYGQELCVTRANCKVSEAARL